MQISLHEMRYQPAQNAISACTKCNISLHKMQYQPAQNAISACTKCNISLHKMQNQPAQSDQLLLIYCCLRCPISHYVNSICTHLIKSPVARFYSRAGHFVPPPVENLQESLQSSTQTALSEACDIQSSKSEQYLSCHCSLVTCQA